LTSYRAILDHSCHFPHFIPSSSYLLEFSGVLVQEGMSLISWEEGAEGPGACSWQKIKSNHEPSGCSPRDPEDNEMSLVRN
jgi:hypothetical protein